jgi:hypothetical protein
LSIWANEQLAEDRPTIIQRWSRRVRIDFILAS